MKNIFIFTLLLTSMVRAEFAPNNLRYISTYDFHAKLNPFFESVWQDPTYTNLIYICFGNFQNFGFSIPATGKPQSSTPPSATITQLQSCITNSMRVIDNRPLMNGATLKDTLQLLKPFLPDSILEKYLQTEEQKRWASQTAFDKLTSEEQALIVQTLVERTLGIDPVIQSYGLILDVNVYRDFLIKQIQPYTSVASALQQMMLLLVLRDEFLTY